MNSDAAASVAIAATISSEAVDAGTAGGGDAGKKELTRPLGDGTFIEVGLYGGGAELDAATTRQTKTRIKVTDPLEVVGEVAYDNRHLVLTHTIAGRSSACPRAATIARPTSSNTPGSARAT